MNETLVDQIARAVLYEGYILYPYRPSVKNRQRWTFGGLCPPSYSEAQQGAEACAMQTQCLVRGDRQARLQVKVRFLQLQQRTAGRLHAPQAELAPGAEPPYQPVDVLEVDGQRYQTWQEAVEREVALAGGPDGTPLRELIERPHQQDFALPRHREVQPVRGADDEVLGVLVRERQAVAARLEVSVEPLEQEGQGSTGLFRVTVGVSNRTPWHLPLKAPPEAPPEAPAAPVSRDEALLRSLVSTHIMLALPAGNGEFISLMDPPEACRAAAAECRNVGCWPVLVGDEQAGEADTMLASPIILYDYPQIAPESAGDLFDATEIDEILTLRILTLTDDEKQAIAGVDERARALLERTQSLAPEQLMQLHGRVGDLRRVNQPARSVNGETDDGPGDAGQGLRGLGEERLSDQTTQPRVRVGGVELKPGDRVRLRPRGRADAFDIVLRGRTATIIAIEQDYEDRIHLAVTVDDDPGSDFGAQSQPGHRFFFSLDEVEPVDPNTGRVP